VFRNIAFSHITMNRAQGAINIEGLPEMPISGLRISDVVATAGIGMKAHHTAALELHNVQVNAASGPAFLIRDSKELELDGVSTRRPLAGVPVMRIDRCPGAVVRGSKASEGTGTFLSVGPGELKGIALEGNALGGARKATEEAATDFWQAPAPVGTPAAKKN
jgi:hypothetical protein